MTRLRIATWNINSVRIRVESIQKFVNEKKPDVICFQETKVVDESFPFEAFRQMGFEFACVFGEKAYNGVAIISKFPLSNVEKIQFTDKGCRHISAKILDEIEIHNLYVPAGGDLPDLNVDKFAEKITFLDALAENFSGKNKKMILLGDFNVAPHEHDVWSHASLRNVVSHTEIEIEKLMKFKNSGGFIDPARDLLNEIDHSFGGKSKKIYSWWSYRNKDWRKSNRGRRLDHVWFTPNLTNSFQNLEIYLETRDWPTPSDHVPVIADFSLNG